MFRRLAATITVLAIASTLIALLVVIPTARTIRALNQTISENRARLEFQYANRQIIRKILNDLERLHQDLPTLRSLAVPEGSELDLVTAVEKTADARNLTHELRLLKPTGAPRAGYARTLGIQITVDGSFDHIAAFVEDLERLPQVFLHPRATITAVRTNTSSNTRAVFNADLSWPAPLPL